MKKEKVVVIGAGPSGLTAAWKLAKEGFEVHLLEREGIVGGFGASFRHKDYILDYGPHAFHFKKGNIVPIVESFFKDGDLLKKNANVKTLANGRYLKYPFEFYNLITQLSPFLILRMVFDFIIVSVLDKFIHATDNNFESWGIRRFGKTLYNFCFGHYTQKVWGMPASLISPKFAAKKIKTLSVKNIISKILGGKGEEHEIYWEKYLYPAKGSGELYNRMAAEFKACGGRLYLNAEVKSLCHQGQKITKVEFTQEGAHHSLDVDCVVSTMAIRHLVLMMNPVLGDYIGYTAKRLKFRGMIFVYMVLNTPRVSEALWIYLLDQRFKFNRVTEQKNLSPIVCPDGKTVLCFEICCHSSDEIWSYSEQQLKELVLVDVQNIKIIDPSLISECFVRKMDDAYAVCFIDYDRQLKDILEHLSQFKNFLTTGRQGLYLHIDMHDSMALGIDAAEFFIGGQQDNLRWYQTQTASIIDW